MPNHVEKDILANLDDRFEPLHEQVTENLQKSPALVFTAAGDFSKLLSDCTDHLHCRMEECSGITVFLTDIYCRLLTDRNF